MGYLFTRHELHALLWAGPITALAKTLNISDVGLAKACRRGDIPLPPRGYWAKLSAVKSATKMPLPSRAPGASEWVEVGPGRVYPFTGFADGPTLAQDNGAPEPPAYDETLEAVEARIQKALPKTFKFVRSFDAAHPAIARLLREDQARREEQAKSKYVWDAPRFDSRFEQRRLCFLSNLFTLLAVLDVQPAVRGRDARELSVRVGSQNVELAVETAAKLKPRSRPVKASGEEPMIIEVDVARWKHDEAEERLFWSDGDDGKLENQLREIAVAIVLAGERQYRKGRQFFYKMDCRFPLQSLSGQASRRFSR